MKSTYPHYGYPSKKAEGCIDSQERPSTWAALYEARLRNADIHVEKRKRAKEPVVCFEGDIRHVISNLVRNSIDAMPLGGRLIVRSRGGTNWKTGEKGLVLTVADNGEGMSSEILARSFEPFFTTKGISGVGLGLWISREIMERHRGAIKLRSKVNVSGNGGTIATIFLPFLDQSQQKLSEGNQKLRP